MLEQQTERLTMLKKFTKSERHQIGLACLDGSTASGLASHWGCSVTTVERCVGEVVKSIPGNNMDVYLEEFRKPGIGAIKAYRNIYIRLKPISEQNLLHCSIFFRVWDGQPEMLISHGCDAGSASIVGQNELESVANSILSFLSKFGKKDPFMGRKRKQSDTGLLIRRSLVRAQVEEPLTRLTATRKPAT